MSAICIVGTPTGNVPRSRSMNSRTSRHAARPQPTLPPPRRGPARPSLRLQLADTLSAVIAQRLVPRVGGGILAVYEVLLANSPVRDLIREGKTNQLRNAMQMSLSAGHLTMEMSLNEPVRAGLITQETAVATAFVSHEVDPSLSSAMQHEDREPVRGDAAEPDAASPISWAIRV
jgi:twitching motility protein PilT